MQKREVVFATNEIYHVFNRTVGREQLVTDKSQLQHFVETVKFYRYPQTIRLSEYKNMSREAKEIYHFRLLQITPIVEIYAYSFMPNHYHFLVKQLEDNGIRQFVSLLQNSYAKYFNTRYDRHGSLFQSPFKGKWIESDEQFIQTSRYIHLNHVTSYIIPLNNFQTMSILPLRST